MKRLITCVAAIAGLALPSMASAQDAVSDHIGQLGFGYFTSDAPVGIRYWSSESLGFEGGIGFRSTNNNPIVENGSADTTSLLNFALEAGLLLVLSSDSNMILFVRPGFSFSSAQQIIADTSSGAGAGDQVKESATTFSVSGMIGVELFLTKFGFPNLSFGGGHGLIFSSASPAGDGDSTTTIATALASVDVFSDTNVGFHFYF